MKTEKWTVEIGLWINVGEGQEILAGQATAIADAHNSTVDRLEAEIQRLTALVKALDKSATG